MSTLTKRANRYGRTDPYYRISFALKNVYKMQIKLTEQQRRKYIKTKTVWDWSWKKYEIVNKKGCQSSFFKLVCHILLVAKLPYYWIYLSVRPSVTLWGKWDLLSFILIILISCIHIFFLFFSFSFSFFMAMEHFLDNSLSVCESMIFLCFAASLLCLWMLSSLFLNILYCLT